MRIGSLLVGNEFKDGEEIFYSASPNLNVEFVSASSQLVEMACQSANEAFRLSTKNAYSKRIDFLEQLILGLSNNKDKIGYTYCLESKLSKERFEQEFIRVLKQIDNFKNWLIVRQINGNILKSETIDGLVIRKSDRPIGPVAVFGASNFPLAYSTVGGDVISAISAGCPVVVKAHPFHVYTSHICAEIISNSLQKAGMHLGFFSHLLAADYSVGKLLVMNPFIKSVAFTGGVEGGRSLMELAANRTNPIPVFAEMGSMNPVVILPNLDESFFDCTQELASAIITDNGQFCTKPGLILYVGKDGFSSFREQLAQELGRFDRHEFLHFSIEDRFNAAILELESSNDVWRIDNGAVIITTNVESYLHKENMRKELFGPATICVTCQNEMEVMSILQTLGGQLTVSLFTTDLKPERATELMDCIFDSCGRVVLNGVPTGVRPVQAMHHGGPFPASSDSRFTAVGVDSVWRFLRPWTLQCSEKEISQMEKILESC